jgi:hypothetical protein
MARAWKSWVGSDLEVGPSSILALLKAWDRRSPVDLPDEGRRAANEVRYASGAWDGIATHHMATANGPARAEMAKRVIEALKSASEDETARSALHDLFLTERVVPYADAIIEGLTQQREIGPDEVRPHARWLVTTALQREPLKLGIVLLGAAGTEDDLPDLVALARHDEFTLFAAVAAGSLLDDPVDCWWEMAKNVQGWGKIHVVERLARRVAERPDVRAWFLRHGCANTVMAEYLAHVCATAGQLHAALEVEGLDDELLEGACLIVQSLLNGGPADDMDGYEHGVEVVRALLDHLETRCDSLRRLDVVRAISQWLDWPAKAPPAAEGALARPPEADPWNQRSQLGWTEATREGLAKACRAILDRPAWPDRVRASHARGDERERTLAWSVAASVGIDLWEDAFARLETEPVDPPTYYHLLRSGDLARIARVVAFAEARLPLDRIARGPRDMLGTGPEFRPHECLDFLLQEMRRDEVFSPTLVATGLRSATTRNRNMAMAAIEQRPAEKWGETVKSALRRAAREEPRDDLREKLQKLVERLD